MKFIAGRKRVKLRVLNIITRSRSSKLSFIGLQFKVSKMLVDCMS